MLLKGNCRRLVPFSTLVENLMRGSSELVGDENVECLIIDHVTHDSIMDLEMVCSGGARPWAMPQSSPAQLGVHPYEIHRHPLKSSNRVIQWLENDLLAYSNMNLTGRKCYDLAIMKWCHMCYIYFVGWGIWLRFFLIPVTLSFFPSPY